MAFKIPSFILSFFKLILLLPSSSMEGQQAHNFEHITISISSPSEHYQDRVLPGYERIDDMILPTNFFNTQRNAVPDPKSLWPNATVPYVIDSSLLSQLPLIKQAMNQFHTETCVRFVPRTNQLQYIHLIKGQGCYSYVGMVSMGGQPVSLGQGCHYVGTIVHELNHAVGFFHEQNRSDRDDFINIYWQNIQQGLESQFKKLKPTQNLLLTAFDYDSIMIYGEYAFSKDGHSKTMEDKYGVHTLKNPYDKPEFTVSDVTRINMLYKCKN